MKVFIFDTETTGFISKKETDLTKQPKIVQFAGILGNLVDGTFTEEKRVNILINPEEPIPYGASQVHHIYDIDVRGKEPITSCIDEIMRYINEPDIIVGHNIEYDQDMVKLELKRLQREYEYKPKQVICTMKSSVDFCALEGNGNRFKYPKLGELHKKLFDQYFSGAHDAMIDVEATTRSFVKLVNEGVIEIQETKDEIMSLF
ncbi:MAG: 3'-5' exonuclease [Candidatus Gracilibacteria bacterium]|nr:3'-5' exonuclease [Candidatus Gracilibacteria bacterium]